MLVNNPLELYSVYIGWREYDYIFSALYQIGLTLLPFLMLIFENITQPFEQPFGDAADTSLRRVCIELFFMAVIFMVCVYPNWPLQMSDIQYKPHCSSTGQMSTPGHSGTTYDSVFENATSSDEAVYMPPAFALVTSIASGFTNGLIEWSIPCETNLREMMGQLTLSNFSSDLSEQVKRFNSECYLRANNQFQTQKPDYSSYQSTMEANGGESDLQWVGSHVYQQLYYSNLQPDKPVPGFPYSQFPSDYVDDAVLKGEMTAPEDGYPNCQQWWSDGTYGIQSRIVKEMDEQTAKQNNNYLGAPNLSSSISGYIAKSNKTWNNNLSSEDFIARQSLYASVNADGQPLVKNNSFDANQGIMGSIAGVFVDLGQVKTRYLDNPAQRAALSEIFPTIQAFLYMFIVMFLPIVLVLGRYRFRVFFTLSIMLFAIIFCDFIWDILGWFENALYESLENPLSPGTRYFQNSYLSTVFTALYLLAPMFFISLMSIAGYHLGGAMDGMMMNAGGGSSRDLINNSLTPTKMAGYAKSAATKIGGLIK